VTTIEQTSRDTLFLPDFCAIRMVFAVVVVGQLLAFVLALTPYFPHGNLWSELALISLFVQWVGLTSAGLLCISRRWLRLLDNVTAGILSYALVLLVTLLLSEFAFFLVQQRFLDVRIYTALQLSEQSPWFAQQQLVDVRLTPEWHLEYLLRNLAIGAIVAAVALRYFYVQYQWKSNLESEAQARIQALQSRIRPHFLFNCMNTIASFTRSKPALAEQVVEDLADLFRVSLGDARFPVTLGRELEVCRQYLRIEGLRLGDRLQVDWDTDALPTDALIPALTLQPIVENAIYHGIEPAPHGGWVRLSGKRLGERLQITITNSLDKASSSQHRGNQLAQDNVRQRLQAFFDDRSKLAIVAVDQGYRVQITVPYLSEAPGKDTVTGAGFDHGAHIFKGARS